MNIWKRGVCLLLTLVMAVALAGCGTRREPQTLRVCLPELPGTLDPAMVTTDSERIVVSHLYENLMKLSSDGQGGSRVEAGAARKYTCTDNNDGTQTYTFTLRDMKWSDGQKVTAADFVYAWQRLADPATVSPNAALLEMVAGYRQVRSSGDVSKLQVSAPEENTFVVTLSNRCAYFLSAVCTAAATMPVRSEQPKNWQADPTALCTNGAYRISEWKNGLLTATVPESYYDQRRLQMSTLVFRFETDAAMRTELLKKNEIRSGMTGREMLFCGKLTAWLFVLFCGFSLPKVLLSVGLLVLAVLLILFGFWKSRKPVRIYGLILVLVSICKLILLDISYGKLELRAFSFLICGVICFGISFLYNRMDKNNSK